MGDMADYDSSQYLSWRDFNEAVREVSSRRSVGGYREPGTNPYEVGSGHWNREEERRERGMNRIEVIQVELARLQKELAKLSRYPRDNFLDGTVIKFDKVFGMPWSEYEQRPENIRVYNYAAIKAGGKWYTTGPKTSKGYDWSELIEWLGDTVKEIWVMHPAYEMLSYKVAEEQANNTDRGWRDEATGLMSGPIPDNADVEAAARQAEGK